MAASAALGASTLLPRSARAQSAVPALTATSRALDINGRAAKLYGLTNATGGTGLILNPSQQFRVDLTNQLNTETLIHWHGQIPPNVQGGLPDMPMPKLASTEISRYDFEALPCSFRIGGHFIVRSITRS